MNQQLNKLSQNKKIIKRFHFFFLYYSTYFFINVNMQSFLFISLFWFFLKIDFLLSKQCLYVIFIDSFFFFCLHMISKCAINGNSWLIFFIVFIYLIAKPVNLVINVSFSFVILNLCTVKMSCIKMWRLFFFSIMIIWLMCNCWSVKKYKKTRAENCSLKSSIKYLTSWRKTALTLSPY